MTQLSTPKTRILDIALQSGVSTATVDRVLHGRPGVRDSTRDKVLQAAQILDNAANRPQVIPSIAADLDIDVVIAGSAGFANDVLARSLAEQGEGLGVTIRMSYPHRLNPEAQAEALQTCVDRRTSGIIVQSLDHPLVRGVIDEATALNIPVVSMLTSLPSSTALGYVGLDNRAAGRTAGLLMGSMLNTGEIGLFVGGPLYRGHEEREIGFRTIMREEFPNLNILPICQTRDNPKTSYEMALALIEEQPELCGIYNVGGGNRGIERALHETNRAQDIHFCCFNLTPLTRSLLLSGVINTVIHQDMQRIAKDSISAIINFSSSRPWTFEAIPIEIIMRENVNGRVGP